MSQPKTESVSPTSAQNVMTAAEKIVQFVCENIGESAEVQTAALEVATRAIESTAAAQNIAESKALFRRRLSR